MKNLRLSVIHMRGTEDMSTKDVFKYFEHYAPSSIEWINDVSCKKQKNCFHLFLFLFTKMYKFKFVCKIHVHIFVQVT